MKYLFNFNCKMFFFVNLVICFVLLMELFDDIFMVEFGEKFDFFGDFFVKLFVFWIEWNFFDGIKFFV